MKKTILGAFALLLTSNIFACHFWPQGSCGDTAYFKAVDFYNGSILQYRYQGGDGTVLNTVSMPDTGNTDRLFAIPYPAGVSKFGAEWRYYYQGAWTEWLTDSSSSTDMCKVLAVSFTDFTATKKGNDLQINFTNEDESGVDHYDILLSKDGQNWDTKKSIPATGQHSYSITFIGYSLGVLIPLFFVGFKRRRSFYFLSLATLILFFSCKKEMTESKVDDYHYAKGQAVSKDGFITTSKIFHLKT